MIRQEKFIHSKEILPIQGEMERIVYQSDEDSYTVARFRPSGQPEEITITGNLAGVKPGEILKLKGAWFTHKKFGPQFRVESFTCLVPSSVRGIERYLSSGLIKGIGPVMAKRLVQMFGEETLEIIESMPERLSEVEGIGPKRVSMIIEAWKDQKEIKQIMLFLQGHDVSAALAVKIYKQYGQEAINVVQENPYRLATDIFGIGFKTADKIAQKIGIPSDSPMRARAGILFILNQMADKGHCFLPLNILTEECRKVLEIRGELINEAIQDLSGEKHIFVEDIAPGGPKNGSGQGVYLASFYTAETGICRFIKRLSQSPRGIRNIDSEKALPWVETRMGMTLDPVQREAVSKALNNKIMVITGGPGTGKTTIIKAILTILNELKIRISLAAPTGRAAKRMQEATHHEAKTIHRLLEFSPQKGKFLRDEKNPLRTDFVILDEVSMIDTILMYHLLKAIPTHACLILIGDSNQLPSVGAGNVLSDICASKYIDTVKLEKIFRQAQKSLIVTNAHRLLIFQQGMTFPKDRETRTQWWILWRRVTGGLNQNQQTEIFRKIVPYLIPQKKVPPGPKPSSHELAEMWRLAASLERLTNDSKEKMGSVLLDRLSHGKFSFTDLWALARLGARQPLYGSVHTVVPVNVAEEWIAQLLTIEKLPRNEKNFTLTQLARNTSDRVRNVREEIRQRVIDFFSLEKEKILSGPHCESELASLDRAIQNIQKVSYYLSREQNLIFGESLPKGLQLLDTSSVIIKY